MLQLDWMSDDGGSLRNAEALRAQLKQLKVVGVRGIMADVWWGLCEPQPGIYNFEAVQALCAMLEEVGLELQAVMSFHQCGGNVGDSVTIPLPTWAMGPAEQKGLLYRSRGGVVSRDCLSLSADNESVFPDKQAGTRTALRIYREFMQAFLLACGKHVGTTVVELQVGMGPCGELRYPSYLLSNGWNYPGMGCVMAHDAGMLRMLKQMTGLEEPPKGLPEEKDQNEGPETCQIFRASQAEISLSGFRCEPAKVFLEWYCSTLLHHCRDVLKEAAIALEHTGFSQVPGGQLCMAVKVAGLHWHVMHPSRATETCAGYNCCTHDAADAYNDIARLLSEMSRVCKRPVLFSFTCLEMNNWSNGLPQNVDLSAPEDLIAQVRRACIAHGVGMSGENALEFDLASSDSAFSQIEKQIRSWSPGCDAMRSVTLLRCGEKFVSTPSLQKLGQFISKI